MIAHAPTLSSVSRSSAHRSFWAIVPFPMTAAPVSPMETPIAVTIPGQTLHNSMIGIMVNAMLSASFGPSARSSTDSPASIALSRSMRFLKLSRCMASMPKVLKSLRSRSYGGMSPNSSSSRCGRISRSTKSRTASRTICCSSDHSCTVDSCSLVRSTNLTGRSSLRTARNGMRTTRWDALLASQFSSELGIALGDLAEFEIAQNEVRSGRYGATSPHQPSSAGITGSFR